MNSTCRFIQLLVDFTELFSVIEYSQLNLL